MGRLPLAAVALICACTNEPEPALEPPPVPAIPYCEAVSTWDPAHAEFEERVLELVNLRRAKGFECGGGKGEFLDSGPLTMNPALRCAARKHTAAMVAQDMFVHEFDQEGLDEPGFIDRAALAQYQGQALAQTIAAGQRDPAQVVNAWISNDGNCATLMDPDATELGVGYLPASAASYPHYWTQVFGRDE